MQPHDDVSSRIFRSLIPSPLESFFPRIPVETTLYFVYRPKGFPRGERGKMILKDFPSSRRISTKFVNVRCVESEGMKR